MLTLKLKVKKFLFGYRKVKTKILKLFIIVKEINKLKKFLSGYGKVKIKILKLSIVVKE